MTYGLSTRAFIEDGPVEQVAKAEARARPPAHGARSTRPRRLEVDRAGARARQRPHRQLPARALSDQNERGKDGHHGR